MNSSSLVSFQHLLMPHNIPASSCLIKPSISEWPTPTTYHSIITTASVTSSPITSSSESTLPPPDSQAPQPKDYDPIPMTLTSKFATGGMPAAVPPNHASTVTSASPVAKNTKRKIVEALNEGREQSELGALCWKQLRWSCSFLLVCNMSPCTPSMTFTEIVSPLPHIPTTKLHNPIPNTTVTSHPEPVQDCHASQCGQM